MSGSFEGIDVPPTIVSFAVSVTDTGNVISPEFKASGRKVYLLAPEYKPGFSPDYDELKKLFATVEGFITSGKVVSAWAITGGGTAAAIPQMCFGNHIGFKASKPLSTAPLFGGFVVEAADALPEYADCLLGETVADYTLTLVSGEAVNLAALQKTWEDKLAPVFPWDIEQTGPVPDVGKFTAAPHILRSKNGKLARPKVIIPAFPGTNCEDDTARAFRRAGADTDVFIVRNRTAGEVAASVDALAKKLSSAQILAIPGGFSGGDEPDGSAKFITSFFRNPKIAGQVMELLNKRDGLITGICNGFQALVKLGLLPYGEIRGMGDASPTLTYNRIGRHQSMLSRTRIVSNKSPWLMNFSEGDVFTVPVDHGEGRFVADEATARALLENGQVATVYVDDDGNPTQDARHNPNNSVLAIEGILSPDGRIYGKMAHNERAGDGLYKNVPGDHDMDMFRGAVEYYQ
jgi:phosphoribosylformylglycinamidine synthase